MVNNFYHSPNLLNRIQVGRFNLISDGPESGQISQFSKQTFSNINMYFLELKIYPKKGKYSKNKIWWWKKDANKPIIDLRGPERVE